MYRHMRQHICVHETEFIVVVVDRCCLAWVCVASWMRRPGRSVPASVFAVGWVGWGGVEGWRGGGEIHTTGKASFRAPRRPALVASSRACQARGRAGRAAEPSRLLENNQRGGSSQPRHANNILYRTLFEQEPLV